MSRGSLEVFEWCLKGVWGVSGGCLKDVSSRAEKSAEAFREQKFKGMCVPEVSNQ